MTPCPRRVRTSAVLAAGLLLTGCAVTPDTVDQPELSEGDVTITFAWWGADDRTQQTLEAIEIFEEEYPNITVEPQYADWAGYWDRLATMTAGGDMPDVAQFDEMYLASYADRGSLLDLSTVSNILDVSALEDPVLDTGSVNDTLYAVPTGAAPNALAVNTTLFEELGVDLPDFETWTWDDLHEVGLELHEASDGEYNPLGAMCLDNFSLNVWLRQHGEDLFDREGNVAASPETIAACWDRVAEWIDSGAADSAHEMVENHGVPLDQTGLSQGETLIGFIAGGVFTAQQAAAPQFDFVLGQWPTDDDTADGYQYMKPSMYWSASASSDHPAESALLMDFLTNDTRVAEIFRLDRGLPAHPQFQEVVEPHLDESGAMAMEFNERAMDHVGDAPPITPNGGSVIATIQVRYGHEALLGEKSTQQAAEEFLAEMQDSIDRSS
ncbi:ABC transporter substrate-binding protein [Nocardiopsis sp. MG754419]|uniref:ABC transporter substrate-binding protein n=1 Tax=Nocardiopsis sp. MG754419 TaxID=2259865 RepID=UPI001BAB952E|nr:extracellular solute-binding protein [Nocardiopsis sp. MG754419]MBR8745013.1 hypothetical protein [Nocardiopsis sp. MG754419]